MWSFSVLSILMASYHKTNTKGYEGHWKYLSTTWYLLFSEEKSIILPKYPLKCDVLSRQWCRQHLRIFLFEIIPHDFYNFLSPVQIIQVQRSPLCWVSLWPRISVIGDIVVCVTLCVGWTGLVPWFDAIIPDVMLLCWPRRINTEFTDTLWHHWREAPSGLKEIFSGTIMIMSRQIDPQPHPPLAVSAFQFLLPVFPPKSNILCPLFSLSFLERIVSL